MCSPDNGVHFVILNELGRRRERQRQEEDDEIENWSVLLEETDQPGQLS